ncbi:primosomal protein N' (replication factor Y) - superfamily II helicase [Brevirhabdus sp.]|uniref:primosomal protein N' (replication factor Y) - superfamily II helicase n=1 Tax=Brevirhabdus sp. TaxID=2004514 RepID=UPI0040598527
MRFSPAEGLLLCDYCGNQRQITQDRHAQRQLAEIPFDSVTSRIDPAEFQETRLQSCPNCGAQVEFAPDEHATECPFCATPMVLDTGTHRQIKPRGLLPFALTEETAREAMSDWLGSLWFAPNGLQQYAAKGRRMSGIYVPYWTFDADTQSSYTGQRGTVYFETRTQMRDGKPVQVQVQVQRVAWTPVRGRVARFFDDVLVLASTSLPKRYTDGLAPWDLPALEPYRPEFLAGFRAEAYTVALDEGFKQAGAHMEAVIARDIRFDIGGDRQQIDSVSTKVSDVTFKHILLPVWLAAYKYRGKSYRFVVNGRTGTVQGERPYSKVKIAFAVLLGLILAAIAGYFYARTR